MPKTQSLSFAVLVGCIGLSACSPSEGAAGQGGAASEGLQAAVVADGVQASAVVGGVPLIPPGAESCFEADHSTAMRDVCVLSSDIMAGRLVGTPGNALARTYLIDRFEALGLEPVDGSYVHPFDFERAIDFRNPDAGRESFTGYNLIGRIAGRDSSRVMAVTAHYDHVGPGENNEIFNGADDNASGVAGILAIAEHFQNNPPEHDVLIIGFDAEEGGLNGARHLVANPIEGLAEISFNLNLDMLAYSPDGDIWAAGTYHTPELLPLVEAVAQNASIQLEAGYDRPTGDPREDWTLLSDHGPFHLAGIAFLYIGVEDHEHYHQASDEFAIVDAEFFDAVIDMVVDLAERSDAALGDIAKLSDNGKTPPGE